MEIIDIIICLKNIKTKREYRKNRYHNMSEEYKNKKREYGKNRYHHMSEEKKQN